MMYGKQTAADVPTVEWSRARRLRGGSHRDDMRREGRFHRLSLDAIAWRDGTKWTEATLDLARNEVEATEVTAYYGAYAESVCIRQAAMWHDEGVPMRSRSEVTTHISVADAEALRDALTDAIEAAKQAQQERQQA